MGEGTPHWPIVRIKACARSDGVLAHDRQEARFRPPRYDRLTGAALDRWQPEPCERSGSARSHLALDGLGLGGSRSRGARSGGLPAIPAAAWGLIVLLATVNTAFAFTLWTHTQRSLAGHESTIINNTMTVQIALLAFLFLGDPLAPARWAAIVLVFACTLGASVRAPMAITR